MARKLTKQERYRQISPSISDADVLLGTTDPITGSLEIVPIAKIRLDPGQPRKLQLSLENPAHIEPNDPDREAKEKQLEKLHDMARSIKSQGLVQEVVVYPHGDGYLLAVGERRLLACKLAGLESIHVKLLPERPADLLAKQLIENLNRVDLTLAERINAIEKLVAEKGGAMTGAQLGELLGCSERVGYRYLAIVGASPDVRRAIDTGIITAVLEAARIAAITDANERAEQIAQLDPAAHAPRAVAKQAQRPPTRAGRPATTITVRTKSTKTARYIIERLLTKEEMATYEKLPWDDLTAVMHVFSQIVKKIDKELEGDK